jgi:hypothetical protein
VPADYGFGELSVSGALPPTHTSAEQLTCVADPGELIAQARLRCALNVPGTDHRAVRCSSIKRVGCVTDEEHLEAEVASDPGRGLAAVIAGNPGNGDRVDASPTKPCREVGSAVKSGVNALVTSRSGSPVMTSLKALPELAGASGDPGSLESWRT